MIMVLWNIQDTMKNRKSYNGNTYKFGITVEGKDYIVKYPKGDDLSVLCEFTASRVISAMNIPCQKVSLGMYEGNLVDVIEDFTSGKDWMLHSFRDTKQSSEDTDIGDKEYTYNDVTYLIEKHLKLQSEQKLIALQRFWQMFLCDAILANRDRHWGNWGYLSDGAHYFPAPIYDNGACLFPNVNQIIDRYSDCPEEFLKERVHDFPASLLMINRESPYHPGVIRPHRSNYYEVLGDTQMSSVFNDEKLRFSEQYSPQFFYTTTKEVLADVDGLLDVRIIKFWKSIVPLRFACLVRRDSFETAYGELMKTLEEDDYA